MNNIFTYTLLKQQCMAIGGVLFAIALTTCNTSATSQSPIASTLFPGSLLIAASPIPPSSLFSSTDIAQSEQQAAAIQVIRNYYEAINHRDYSQAYLLWDRQGAASQQSFKQFKEGYANTQSTSVTVAEPSRVDPAAGSVYIEIPMTITAVTKSGTQQKFRGSYVLRRANSGSVSMPEAQQWHLYSATITQV